MKVFNFIFILISFSVFVFSDKELISAKLENILPDDAVIESIEPSVFDGISAITVFTDVDCGYCRKLHSQISEYNKVGITVKYAAFPRSGIGTQTFTRMVGAWCADDPKKVITDLKNDKKLNLDFCDDQPIAKHYVIGQKLGISGTPAIITPDGELIPGYVSPEELLSRLKA